jgi:hypothetical protein
VNGARSRETREAVARRGPVLQISRMAKSWAEVHVAARATSEALHREAEASRAQAEAAHERVQALLAVAEASRREADASPDEYYRVSRWHNATIAETRARAVQREASALEGEARAADAEADTAHARADAARARADREAGESAAAGGPR